MTGTPQISGGRFSGRDLAQKLLGGVSQLVIAGMVFSNTYYATITEAATATDSCDATVVSFTGSSVRESATAATLQDAATIHVNSSYATLDPANKDVDITLSAVNSVANLKATGAGTSGHNGMVKTTLSFTLSDKKWCEFTSNTQAVVGSSFAIGIANSVYDVNSATGPGSGTNAYALWDDGGKETNGTFTAGYCASLTPGTVVNMAFDGPNGTITIYVNGVSQGTMFSSIPSGTWFFYYYGDVFGNAGSFNFGQNPASNNPPSGFSWLGTAGGTDYGDGLLEVAAATDTTDATVVNAGQSVTEAASASDSATATLITTASRTEAATAADTVAASLNTSAAIAEAASAGDTNSASTVSSNAVTEAASAAETQSIALATLATISEAGSAADSNSATKVTAATISEAATADTLQSASNLTNAAITEAATATDSSDRSLVTTASITEAASAADTQSATVIMAADITEVATAVDTVSSGGGSSAAITEVASATDTSDAAKTQQADITEAGSAADSQAVILIATGIINEVGAATDSSSAAAIKLATITETAAAVDTCDAVKIVNASITETATATDFSTWKTITPELFTGVSKFTVTVAKDSGLADATVIATSRIIVTKSATSKIYE